MPESLEHAKGRALTLTAAGKSIEAICVMLHCLRGLGVDPLAILDRLQLLRMHHTATHEMTEGVWKWITELES